MGNWCLVLLVPSEQLCSLSHTSHISSAPSLHEATSYGMVALPREADRTLPMLKNILLDDASIDLGMRWCHLRDREGGAIIHRL